jgi:bifunctional DNase/RNase
MAEEHESGQPYDAPPDFFAEAYESGSEKPLRDWGAPVQVHVEGAFRACSGESEEHCVVLSDGIGKLVIVIGRAEWVSIRLALAQRTHDRPLTHDFLLRVVEALDADVDRVLIDDEQNGTFYAKAYFDLEDEIVEVDCRPSDAMALAIRAQAPIFVSSGLLYRD